MVLENMDELTKKLFSPVKLAGLELRNRIIKTGAYEGMSPDGVPSDLLVEHHRELAENGVGLTTLAYCAVSPNGRTFEEQMYLHEGILPDLERVTSAVHEAGGAISSQFGHCGYFTKNKALTVPKPLGPSTRLNEYGLTAGHPFSKAMTKQEISQTTEEYANAASIALRAGFDAIEVHMGHGYLLSQFISPLINKRGDEYGGPVENRVRFPVEVVKRVREVVGGDFPILAKINLSDGVKKGGAMVKEAVQVAMALEAAGINALVMSGGITSRSPLYLLRGGRPLKEMIAVDPSFIQRTGMRFFGPFIVKEFPFKEMFFRDEALQVRKAVNIPLVYLGGIVSAENMRTAMRDGFDFVAMGRPLLRDPQMIKKILDGDLNYISDCDQCNKCIVAMDTPGGARCVMDEPDFLKSKG
jgi:2,4-dienoyl-CoA reductase-like NADH-dependent reductase (Old Yellow Enzyme family)